MKDKKTFFYHSKFSRCCTLILAAVFFATSIGIVSTDIISASSAYPGMQKMTQPDGTEFEYRMVGDEFFHYCVNEDGAIIQKDADTGVWKQVKEENGDLSFGKKAEANKSGDLLKAADLNSTSARKAYSKLADTTYTASSVDYGKPAAVNSSSVPLLAIVVGFDGDGSSSAKTAPYENGYDWNDFLFNGARSLENYYKTISNNAFTFSPAKETCSSSSPGNTNTNDKVNDGIIHVKLNKNHTNWGREAGLTNKAFFDAAFAALDSADQYIKFSEYDKNKNGKIEATELSLLFIMGGWEASANEESAPSTWAHRWNLSGSGEGAQTHDGVKLDPYITIGEKMEIEDTIMHGTVATIAHELGHILGLPDLYDTLGLSNEEWSDYKVDALSLMAGGNWNLDEVTNEFIPGYFDPYCRTQLGYLKAKTITGSGTYMLNSTDSSAGYNAYRINTDNKNEYFAIENRQYENFDCGLKNKYLYDNPTGGIVIWHIDKKIATLYGMQTTNTVNSADHRPGVMPIYMESEYGPLTWQPFFTAKTATKFSYTNISPRIYDGSNLKKKRRDSGIRIRVLDNGASAMKIKVSFVKLKAPKLTAKTNSYNSVKLKWSKISRAKKYYVYRKATAKGKYHKIKTTTKTSYIDKKLKPGKRYYYKIKSAENHSTSKYSNTRSAKPIPKTPTIKLRSKNGLIYCHWNKIAGADGYQAACKYPWNKKFKVEFTSKGYRSGTYISLGKLLGNSYKYKVRGFKSYKGKRVYSHWSKVKAIKTKI